MPDWPIGIGGFPGNPENDGAGCLSLRLRQQTSHGRKWRVPEVDPNVTDFRSSIQSGRPWLPVFMRSRRRRSTDPLRALWSRHDTSARVRFITLPWRVRPARGDVRPTHGRSLRRRHLGQARTHPAQRRKPGRARIRAHCLNRPRNQRRLRWERMRPRSLGDIVERARRWRSERRGLLQSDPNSCVALYMAKGGGAADHAAPDRRLRGGDTRRSLFSWRQPGLTAPLTEMPVGRPRPCQLAGTARSRLTPRRQKLYYLPPSMRRSPNLGGDQRRSSLGDLPDQRLNAVVKAG